MFQNKKLIFCSELMRSIIVDLIVVNVISLVEFVRLVVVDLIVVNVNSLVVDLVFCYMALSYWDANKTDFFDG